MMFRSLSGFAVLAVLAACAPDVPDSARGVGFDNSLDAQRAREEALARGGQYGTQPMTVLPPAYDVQQSALGGGVYDGSAAATAAETQRILESTRPGSTAQAGLAGSGAAAQAPYPQTSSVDTSGISDENDFGAVSQRETIASDKARIENNRAQYEVIQPEALPSRTGGSQPNIVAYALQSSNGVGVSVYRRSSLGGSGRNCGKYASPDLAQIDFLGRGGPERDPQGLDPDGDGFACDWDPTPFRKAAQNG